MAKNIDSCFSIILILALGLLSRGSIAEKCGLGNIQYKVERSGRIVQGQTEWNVAIYHTCKVCSLGHIVFGNCKDWKTKEPVDPAIFSKDGNFCHVKKGQFIKPSQNVSFSYAWDSPVIWVPKSAQAKC